MPPTNDFLPFCPTSTGTNLLTESEYAAATDRTTGNQPGIASSKLNNKALRQANAIGSQIAQFVANKTNTDVVDDADFTKLLAQITGALTPFAPNLTKLTSGSGTFNLTYIFMIASGSATAGATYTNNTVTYTVVATVASGTVLKATGNGDPSASGTLTKASGVGDATLTFYTSRKASYLSFKAVGGGGGGAGGPNAAGAGGDGGDTTFGPATAHGGTGGAPNAAQGSGPGGAASLGSGPVGQALSGAAGANAPGTNNAYAVGGDGGATPFGGEGVGGGAANAGGAGVANTGSGGGGGGGNAGTGSNCGAGGGAGGYVSALILSPASSYAYSVGGGGTAGTGTYGGGAGGSGFIEVIEFYQ